MVSLPVLVVRAGPFSLDGVFFFKGAFLGGAFFLGLAKFSAFGVLRLLFAAGLGKGSSLFGGRSSSFRDFGTLGRFEPSVSCSVLADGMLLAKDVASRGVLWELLIVVLPLK